MTEVKLPPVTDRGFTNVKSSVIHGKGVFAKKLIPKGTRLYEYTGVKVERNKLPDDFAKGLTSMVYVMNLDEHMVIDGERDGNDARYINHSCNPNCEVFFLNNTPFIYSTEEIKAGEELSYDYRLGNIKEEEISLEQKKEWFPCNCGSPQCRGTMMGDKKFY